MKLNGEKNRNYCCVCRFIVVNWLVILFSYYCCICIYIYVYVFGIFFFLLLNDYLFLWFKIDLMNNFKINVFKSLDFVNEVNMFFLI